MNIRIPNGFEKLGLENIGKVYYNLSYDELQIHEVNKGECKLSSKGAGVYDTGLCKGRSPKDRYFVDQPPSNQHIAWGDTNQKISKDIFNRLLKFTKNEFSDKDIYIMDVFAGANKNSRKSIRFISETAYQAHFVKNMFISPNEQELDSFEPDLIIYSACKMKNRAWERYGLNSEVFICFNIEDNISIIGGTCYTGEIKGVVFTMMNYWLPLDGKLSMNCSANIGKEGDVSLFFGLEGTGRTVLSTDLNRPLIGYDEHGWDDSGIFNLESGCYINVRYLQEGFEPEIFGAIKKNALLENVVIVDNSGLVDYEDFSKTTNIRTSYPMKHIINHKQDLQAGHPKNIILLTYDAFGVLPIVSKLTNEQAVYYFLSGYFSNMVRSQNGEDFIYTLFSACYAEPFLPLSPTIYAKLFKEKIDKHNVNVYLMNIGLKAKGKRVTIQNIRTCVNAILNGTINSNEFDTMPIFNLQFPKTLEGVNSSILNPRALCDSKEEFDKRVIDLANKFIENFKRYDRIDEFDYSQAGPQV